MTANKVVNSRINDVLYEIHKNISAELSVRQLADIASYSEQHLQRVFSQNMGASVHQYICRARLEQAANQLMFDPSSRVADIAAKCGYQSLSSFSRKFKEQWGLSPGDWRKHHRSGTKPDFIREPIIRAGYESIRHTPLPTPQLVETPDIQVAYVRHKGYDSSIQKSWYKLLAWAAENQFNKPAQYALHHSNPIWTPLAECRYVACIQLDKPLLKRGMVNSLAIPGGLHTRFHLTGVYGECIPYISRIVTEWLPNSGLKLKTTPLWVQYEKNHFLDEERRFDLYCYLPVTLY